ncbi:hypothetical protein EJV47_23145 [Hymenobacter gummosus]|uniref:Lipoprotein n=1 Tax=Hymenobacter gummosus TaxID=1776032 RepID=A0A431TX06_9BACT|nr:hypothetical protein [Hymenobacter gummosus]RTQ46052.1 hypothetical protein EJV47_23145 [Hymenobacter gummosus]
MKQTCYRLLSGLLLSGCAAAPGQVAPQAAPAVELQLQAEAEEAYNIVWLRATLRNVGSRAVRIIEQRDSVDLACTTGRGVGVLGFSPQGDSLTFCQQCEIHAVRTPRYVTLKPGETRVTHLKVNFNYVFPVRSLPPDKDCTALINRTPGLYRFQIHHWGVLDRQGGPKPLLGNTVTVRRKQ